MLRIYDVREGAPMRVTYHTVLPNEYTLRSVAMPRLDQWNSSRKGSTSQPNCRLQPNQLIPYGTYLVLLQTHMLC